MAGQAAAPPSKVTNSRRCMVGLPEAAYGANHWRSTVTAQGGLQGWLARVVCGPPPSRGHRRNVTLRHMSDSTRIQTDSQLSGAARPALSELFRAFVIVSISGFGGALPWARRKI